MPEEQRNYADQGNSRNNSCGLFGNMFGGNNCCCGGNSEILFFIIVFLLLFTNFGCCNN